ncbi:MAG: carbohydrate kinase family protein [Syntrophobacterales bacterium]|nr:MAG: carbohydrate kinase family protein [Syntrophobacterales bacterium]
MRDVVGFGALNIDLFYEVDFFDRLNFGGVRLEAGGEIQGSDEEFQHLLRLLHRHGRFRGKSGGGSAANTIFALSRMGFKTAFIGKVGEDEDGDFLMRSLEAAKVDTLWIRRDRRSGVCLIVLDRSSDRSIFLQPNANDTLCTDEVDSVLLSQARLLHMTSFGGELPMLAQKAALEHLSSQGKLSFDPGEIYARRGLMEIEAFIERCQVLFVTDREVALLTSMDYERGCRKLLGYGPDIVVCKRGKAGSSVLSREETFDIPAKEVEAVDSTGAGDVYNAGFLAGMVRGKPLKDCALFATRIAGKSVTGFGRDHYPTEDDLIGFFHSMGDEGK